MTQAPQETANVQAEVIKRLVDGLAAKHAKLSEQRTITRLALNVPVIIYEKITDRERAREVWASDISRKGIGLLTNHELRADRHILIDFEPAIGQRCCIRVHLRRCEELVEGIFRSGGTFLTSE